MTALRAGRVVTEHEVLDDEVVVLEGSVIAAVGGGTRGETVVDLGDVDLVAGLVDVHSDCLEKLVHPRASMSLPLPAALVELDALTIGHGITTSFLCVSLEEDSKKFRSIAFADQLLAAAAAARAELRSDWRVHLRVDVTGSEAVRRTGEIAGRPAVGIVSYMDHTPGQGQYASEATWRAHYARDGDHEGTADLDTRLAAKRALGHLVEEHRRAVAAAAAAGHAVLAAHDDDTGAAVDRSAALGARISEFPITLAVAQRARSLGQGTVMGAPNVRHGRSHLTNLSAREAIGAGALDALASDYHPPSMLAAAYELAAEDVLPLPRALALVSSGPARLAGLGDRGVIAPGQRADLVAVTRRAGVPSVVQAWVAGVPVLGHVAASLVGA